MSEAWYSDNGVDKLLLRILPATGMAVDVGANVAHGSNTLALEESGWTVLCVEPNPKLEAEGRQIRKLWRTVACGAQDSEGAAFYSCGSYPHASMSGMLAQEEGFELFQVPMRQLDRVLHEAGFSRLDLATIDVEGWEKEVLAGFSLEWWKPQVLVVETWKDDMEAPPGYMRAARKEFDNVFVRNWSRAAEIVASEGI